jgi:hypothetical protein
MTWLENYLGYTMIIMMNGIETSSIWQFSVGVLLLIWLDAFVFDLISGLFGTDQR